MPWWVLETTFAQFADEQEALYLPLIDERDQYMAARLLEEVQRDGHENVLAVVGAGHLKGIQSYLLDIDPPVQIALAVIIVTQGNYATIPF